MEGDAKRLPSRKRLHACSTNTNTYMAGGGWDLNRLDSRITYLLKPHLTSQNPTPEEIVEASKAVVEDAVKADMAAKIVAQQKALVAHKAMAAAKKALELVEMKQMLLNKNKNKNKNKKRVDVVDKLRCTSSKKQPRLDDGKAQEKADVVARAMAAAEKACGKW